MPLSMLSVYICNDFMFFSAKMSCFNCGEDHMIAACPKPKNMKRINEARKEFMANSPTNMSQAYLFCYYHKTYFSLTINPILLFSI
jgi:hypothetical protein